MSSSGEALAGYTGVAIESGISGPVIAFSGRLLGDAENELYLSAASCWEIAIKYRLGKLPLPGHPEDFIGPRLLRWHTRFAGVIAACDARSSPADDPP